MNPRLKFSLLCLALAVLCGLAFFFASCSKREQAMSTGAVVQAAALPLPGFKGDTAYAVVRSDALPALYQNFRDVLNKQGLVKWDSRYDCNHFASLYIGLAQSSFTVAAWHSETNAQTLALAEVWYLPNGPPSGHAIVAAMTERGLVFIEPQTGQEIRLTLAQRQSAYLIKW
jgi:hypothetical protein